MCEKYVAIVTIVLGHCDSEGIYHRSKAKISSCTSKVDQLNSQLASSSVCCACLNAVTIFPGLKSLGKFLSRKFLE